MKLDQNAKVFIVEDDPIYQELLKNELEANGYATVEVFSSSKACMDNMHKMPDTILLDYHLDETMDGLQVLRNIKTFNPNIHVIMLSSQERLEVAVNSMKYGAYDYVIKNDSAMQRLQVLLKRIKELDAVVQENKRFKRVQRMVAAGVGILVLVLAGLQLA